MSLKVFLITVAVWISLSSAETLDVEKQQDLSDDYDGDDIMNIIAKREEAKNFFQRDRRGLYHECYAECCTWEEVREHYEFDIERAKKYHNEFVRWRNSGGSCGKTSFW